MRTLALSLLLVSFTLPALAAGGGKASQNPDALAIDQACAAEGQAAGCGAEQVGTGLLRCIGAYKKANKKTYMVSDGCKAAIQKAKADKGHK